MVDLSAKRSGGMEAIEGQAIFFLVIFKLSVEIFRAAGSEA